MSRGFLQAGGLTTSLALVVWSIGCASMNKTEKGAVIGAAGGGAVGGAIGKATGNTARGAILGAVVGGAAGAVIGSQMDKQAEELDDELENASVERMGEGIRVTFDSGILFDFDSDVLRPEARANLQELAGSLTEFPDTEILIVGHTDAVGSDPYNQSLSERRAGSARTYLNGQGIRSARLEATGVGETEPIATNDTEAGRALNRRVEIAIFASEEYREQVSREVGGAR